MMNDRRKRTRIDASVDESLPAGRLTTASPAGNHSSSLAGWRVAGVGVLRPTFDCIVIISSAPVGVLKSKLPLQMLETASHSYDVITYRRKESMMRSKLVVVCARDSVPLQILAQHEEALQHYIVTIVEVAFDLMTPAADPCQVFNKLMGQITKRRQRRRHIRSIHDPAAVPPPGCVPEPTIYFEERKSSVGLKAYIRQRKLPSGGFGEKHVHLEWPLRHKRAITRHLGGNKIKDLLTADFGAFLDRNLRCEQVDVVALGKLFSLPPTGKRLYNKSLSSAVKSFYDRYYDLDSGAERAGHIILRIIARWHEQEFPNDSSTGAVSPAQVRGFLKGLRDQNQRRRRGRPRNIPQRRVRITDYKINRCFQRKKIEPV